MRSRSFLLSCVAVLAAAVPATEVRAADDDAAAKSAKAAVEYFEKYAGKAKDMGTYADLVAGLSEAKHPISVERVARILHKDNDPEHKMIAAATLGGFKAPKEAQDAAGKALLWWLEKGDNEPELRDSVIHSIGQILYRDAVPKLNEVMLGGGDPFVLLTTVRVVGLLDDHRSLPALLELWERTPVGYKWDTGGEVKVDTGAEGTADQEAAEAAWHAANDSKMKGRKKPPVMFRVYVQELIKTVRKITKDETIEMPDQFRAWMEAHREELKKEGIDIPKFKGPSKKASGKDGKDKDGKDGGKGKDEKK